MLFPVEALVCLVADAVRLRQREALLGNPVARGFLDAQEELNSIQESIQSHVAKTLELGRLPQPEDFEGGSCGHGCGCHH